MGLWGEIVRGGQYCICCRESENLNLNGAQPVVASTGTRGTKLQRLGALRGHTGFNQTHD